jgi:hypothetical protein
MTDIARERVDLASQGLVITSRESWDAVQSYASARTVEEPARWFFLHISVTIDGGNTGLTEADDMRDIERIGQERFGIGFPYNAAVFDTGRLYEGQPLTRRGAHTVNDKLVPGFPMPPLSLNVAGRAIVLPQMVTDDVTDAQVDQCARWAAAQKRSGLARRDAPWYGHRDFAYKGCPGDAGYARLPEIRALTEHYTVHGLGGDWFDMATKQDLLDALAEHDEQRSMIYNAVSRGKMPLAGTLTYIHEATYWGLITGLTRPIISTTHENPTLWFAVGPGLQKSGPFTAIEAEELVGAGVASYHRTTDPSWRPYAIPQWLMDACVVIHDHTPIPS